MSRRFPHHSILKRYIDPFCQMPYAVRQAHPKIQQIFIEIAMDLNAGDLKGRVDIDAINPRATQILHMLQLQYVLKDHVNQCMVPGADPNKPLPEMDLSYQSYLLLGEGIKDMVTRLVNTHKIQSPGDLMIQAPLVYAKARHEKCLYDMVYIDMHDQPVKLSRVQWDERAETQRMAIIERVKLHANTRMRRYA